MGVNGTRCRPPYFRPHDNRPGCETFTALIIPVSFDIPIARRGPSWSAQDGAPYDRVSITRSFPTQGFALRHSHRFHPAGLTRRVSCATPPSLGTVS